MTSVADMTAAPIEREIGGKTIALHPLSWITLGRLENWLRESMLAASAAALRQTIGLTHADKRIWVREAHAQTMQVTLLDEAAMGMCVGSIAGMTRVLHAAVLPGRPNTTIDDIQSLFGSDPGMMAEVALEVWALTFPDAAFAKSSKKKRVGKKSKRPPRPTPE